MRARSVLLLVVALGCGLVASIGITQVMARRGAGQPIKDAAAIYVAQEDIPMGDPISPELLHLEEWPKDKIPPSALAKIEDIEKRRPKSVIFKGSPILDNQLWPKGSSREGAQPYIPKGYRVVAVKVDDVIALGGILRPGDRVDVLVCAKIIPCQGTPWDEVLTFLQDIKVFGINEVFEPDTANGDKKLCGARTVELLLTPKQAQLVTLASELGKIRLSLRGMDVDETPAPSGSSSMQLLDTPEKANRALDSGMPESAKELRQAFVEATQVKPLPPPTPPPPTPPPSASPRKAPEYWNMTLLDGPKVNHLTLEPDGDPNGRQATQFWRVHGLPEASSASSEDPSSLPSPATPDAGKIRPGTGGDKNTLPDGNNSNGKQGTRS